MLLSLSSSCMSASSTARCNAARKPCPGYAAYTAILIQHFTKKGLKGAPAWLQGGKEDATKCFVPGSGGKNSLKAFLERRHPGVPSVLLDPKAPAPWRSSPSRVKKSSPNQAPAPFAASPAGPRKGSPARYAGVSAELI